MHKISTRNFALDFLKIFATFAIVFHHYQQISGVYFTNHLNFYGSRFNWGYMVELFFILSGYFMRKHISQISNGDYSLGAWLGRKAKRLLPLVAVSAICYEGINVIYTQVFGKYFFFDRAFTIWGVIITALGIQTGGVFVNPFVNNPTWYISVLLICYLAFYLFTRLSGKLRCSAIYFYIAMILLGFAITTYEIQLPFLNAYTARGYKSFFCGLLLARYTNSYGITKKESFISAFVIAFLCCFFALKPRYLLRELDNILCFIFYPSIIILCETKFVKKIFCYSFWGIWSQISFNVYIWHLPLYPLVSVVVNWLGIHPDISQVSTMYAYLILAELIGAFSFYHIEQPLNRLVDHILVELKCRRQNCQINQMGK